MLIEQPPYLFRKIFPDSIWKYPIKGEKIVYLTFDDGPIPEITPWVLNLLDYYNIKATFFCVGENVYKHNDIYKEILNRGHKTGNHTYHHLKGFAETKNNYIEDVKKAAKLIDSNLFRPPHGIIKLSQHKILKKTFKIVMWDVVTRDYSKLLSPQKVFQNVRKYTRNGSIIVFHDSKKAEINMKYALPKSIEWLLEEGYEFRLV